MGLSVSASAAILFVAFLVCFGVLFGAVTEYYTTVDDIAQDNQDRSMAIQGTAIEFISIDEVNDSFTLVNTGAETIYVSEFELLIDGNMVQPQDYSVTVVGHPGSDLMFPGDEVTFIVDGQLDGGRIMVVTSWGISITHIPNGG